MKVRYSYDSTLADLESVLVELDCHEKMENVFEIFERYVNLPGIIITRRGQFYRMISKSRFYQSMSKQFMFDLFARRPLKFFFVDEEDESYLFFDQKNV